MILFFDTETTGFFQPKIPIDHIDQPHIVQIAAELCDDNGAPVSGFNFIVNPNVPIPVRASDVHGITTERAKMLGVSTAFALAAFEHLLNKADLLCAHNVKFDQGVINVARARRAGQNDPITTALFCTMEEAAPIVNLPPTDRMIAAGLNKPKAPKLEECIQHFFGETLVGAHDAMIDVRACARVFFHLKAMEKAA